MNKDSIKIGVVGLGTVGAGVVRALRRNRAIVRARCGVDVEVRRVADLDAGKLRATNLPQRCLSRDYADILTDPDIQIVVELIGGTTAAHKLAAGTLQAGKHLVLANKALLASHWREIFTLAHRQHCAIGFEASVMAGIPVIRTIEEGLAGNRVRSMFGILNGTSNFILTRIAKRGMEFRRALEEAQRRGLCEANPALDIDGHDAAQKLSILASIALGKWLAPSSIYCEGIGHVERQDVAEARDQFGYVIRPLAIFKARKDKVEARVHPTLVPADHPLAAIENEFNAIHINADTAGPVTLAGKGAGEKPAASGVISDVIGLARALHQKGENAALVPFPPAKQKARVARMDAVETKFYLRFTVVDRPGVLSFITGELGRQKVSIASCHQRGRSASGSVPVVMITHQAREGAVRKALAVVDAARRMVKRKTVAIRIEE